MEIKEDYESKIEDIIRINKLDKRKSHELLGKVNKKLRVYIEKY